MKRTLLIGALLAVLLALPSAAAATGPGIVKGTVKPEAIAGEVEVCVVEAQPSETCTYPASDGTYTLKGLPIGPGNIIEFLPSYRSGYLAQYYDHVSRASEATMISITAPPGPHEKGGINADLKPGGRIEGAISAAPGGAPLAEVEACAFGAVDVQVGCAQTDDSGHYALPTLPPATYRVGFFARGQSAQYLSTYYGGSATYAGSTPVSVGAGATLTGIDAQLQLGGTISGAVSAAADGAQLPGISVCLFTASATRPQQCHFSDEAGEYSFTGLRSGNYQVGFSLSSSELAGEAGASEEDAFLSQYYAGAAGLAGGTPIAVTAPAEVDGVDASLLTPQAPPPAPAAVLPVQLVPAPVPISEPRAKKEPKKKCKRGYRKRKVKGKTRCVRAATKKGTKGKKGHEKG